MDVEKAKENGVADSHDKDKVEKSKKRSEERNRSRSKSHHKKKKSRSRDRDRSRSRKKKDKKSKKSRKRSESRSRSRSKSESRKASRRRKSSRDRSRSRKKSSRDRSRSRKKSSRSKNYKRKSRSHSKSRSRSSRHGRNKERERKSSFKFDSPPKEVKAPQEQEKQDTRSLELLSHLMPNLEQRGIVHQAKKITNYANCVVAGVKDVTPTELIHKMQIINNMQAVQASKVDRKLYIGNLPPGITQQTLVDLLNSALQKMNVNTNPPGKSIISAWISADGHYAFVEFRSPEEANNGFALNNVSIHGQALKVGRPRSYNQQAPQQTTNLNSIMTPAGGVPAFTVNNVAPAPVLPPANLIAKVQPPSRILVLKNMVQPQELEIDEEYDEIMGDVKEECGRYGVVTSIKGPRPKPNETIPGVGKIYVEFATVDEAKEARKALSNKLFGDNKVECSFHSEEKYARDDFTELQ